MEECPECKRFTLYWDYVLNARRCGNTECNYCEVELASGGGIDPEVLNEMHRRREEKLKGGIMDWEDNYISKEYRNNLAEEMEEDLDSTWDKELAEMNEEIVRAILRERKVDEKKIRELLEDDDFRSSVFLYSIVCPFVRIHISGEEVDRAEDAIEEYLTGS